MIRGSLTTLSIANDVTKYFAIIPILFMELYPGLSALDIIRLYSVNSAVFLVVVYSALITVALIPLALREVRCREVSTARTPSGNLLVYESGGIVIPFIAIKAIDVLATAAGLVVRCVKEVGADGRTN